jgi:cytochrome c oxidase subunit 2
VTATRRSAPTSRRAVHPRRSAALAAGMAALLAGCADVRDNALDAASPQASELAGLFWYSLWLGTAIWIAVMVLLAVPIVRSRRRPPPTELEPGDQGSDGAGHRPGDRTTADGGEPVDPGASASGPQSRAPASLLDEPLAVRDDADLGDSQVDARFRSRLLWIGGIIGPAIVLLTLLVYASVVGAATAHVEREDELVVDVIGHMFWWEVSYPEEGIVTANEIHVPVDRPVRLRLTTEDVIHSFWMPRLHGKVDMIPGHTNWLSFEPTETGSFRGNCAEFCGTAHAQMVAYLEVMPTDDFDAWVAGQQQDAAPPEGDSAVEGERVYFEAGCAACHAVRGTTAVAGVGPDLTHLADRSTLAAGIVPNTRENLARLIVDPWGLKPGNPMPPTILSDDELEALLDYLEGLEATP